MSGSSGEAAVEAQQLLDDLQVSTDPALQRRALDRCRELARSATARPDVAQITDLLLAIERCIDETGDAVLADQAREVARTLADDASVMRMIWRLDDPQLTVEERQRLVRVLSMMGDRVAPVLPDVYPTSSETGKAACRRVTQAAGERAVFPLLKRLTDAAPEVAAAAARLLGPTGSGTAFTGLQRALRRPESLVREQALRAMAELRGARLGSAAMDLLRDDAASVRAAAAYALGAHGDRRHAALLVRRLQAEDVETVLVEVIHALGMLGEPDSLEKMTGLARANERAGRWPPVVLAAAAEAATISAERGA